MSDKAKEPTIHTNDKPNEVKLDIIVNNSDKTQIVAQHGNVWYIVPYSLTNSNDIYRGFVRLTEYELGRLAKVPNVFADKVSPQSLHREFANVGLVTKEDIKNADSRTVYRVAASFIKTVLDRM